MQLECSAYENSRIEKMDQIESELTRSGLPPSAFLPDDIARWADENGFDALGDEYQRLCDRADMPPACGCSH